MDETSGREAPPPREAPEKVERAKAFCAGLFERLGAAVDVAVKETPDAIGVTLTPRAGNAVELSSALVAVRSVTRAGGTATGVALAELPHEPIE